MFDIPMNTKGSLDSSGLMGLMGGGQPQQNQPQQQQNYQQPQNNYNQQSQQNYNQYEQQSYQQPVGQQPQNNYQQPVQPMQQAPQPKQRPQGNGVKLKKGQKIALAQPGQSLGTIQVCLGWDVINVDCDLDASAFMLDQSGRVLGDDWFVFYGQTNSPDGSIQHSGDSQGAGSGDDEIITINTDRVNPNVQKIIFVVTINEALENGLNFSMVQNAYVRVVGQNGAEIAKFQLTDYYNNVTSMMVGELYKHNGNWKFNAIGDGVAKDLAGLCAMYGVNVAD